MQNCSCGWPPLFYTNLLLAAAFDCATESKFQHQHISIVEFINTDLDKLRDHLVQQSPIINAFHHTKDQRFSKVVSHLREIGIRLHDSLPKYIDKINVKSMVQERQDLLLDALVVHRAIVIIN